MSGLLISVRDAEEAHVALSTGVNLIDIKEPSRGSLGRADWAVVTETVRQVAGRVPVSVAMGDWAVIYHPASRAPRRGVLLPLSTPVVQNGQVVNSLKRLL